MKRREVVSGRPPRGPRGRRVLQSRSCESLPPTRPVAPGQTPRTTSCTELHVAHPPHDLQHSQTDEGNNTTDTCSTPDSVASEPLTQSLSDSERDKIVEDMHACFAARRKIILSGLPGCYSEQRLSTFLEEYSCKVISKAKDGTVRLVFTTPQTARDGIPLLSNAKFEGQKLSASYGHPDSLLFIGNLPYTYTRDDLLKLFQAHGNILRCFVVVSTQTGLSKGYGFVEFSRKEEAIVAKQDMANKMVGARNLRVDFADNGMQTCGDLQSRTLFVDRLPKGFKDDQKLRDVFAACGTVNFCQVAVTGSGVSRGFAFVDMSTSLEAETAQSKCNRLPFSGSEIRMSFGMPCRPGACILQHKIPGVVQYTHLHGQENQLFPPNQHKPLLASAPSIYLHPLPVFSQPPSERANGGHCLVVPSSFTAPLPTPPPLHTIQQQPVVKEHTQRPAGHRSQKRRAPEPLDDVSNGLMSVYDRPYIGQHQQGIPYTHPLKRIKME